MVLSIKLDSKALEALFNAGGEEVKVQLQNAVVQEFAKKHLKPIVNSEAYIHHLRKLQDIADTKFEQAIATVTKEVGGGIRYMNLTPEFAAKLNSAVAYKVSTMLDASITLAVTKAVQDLDLGSIIQVKLKTQLNRTVAHEVNIKWAEFMKAAVAQANDEIKKLP